MGRRVFTSENGRRLRRPSLGAAIALVAVVALGGIAYSAIPSEGGTFRGCYARTNGVHLGIRHSKGDLRLVDEDEACRSYETLVTWNQQGTPGPAGPEGPPGPEGPAAVIAPVHVQNVCSATNSTFVFCAVDCPTGTGASGGGATSDGNGIDVNLLRSDPRLTDGVATGWLMSLGAPTPRNLVVTVHALCV